MTEDSQTSGRISIASTPEAQDLLARELDAFRGRYPKAAFDVRVSESRDAVNALFMASRDVAVIARELRPEEREAAIRGGLELEGYRFARDALLIVVHPSNPVENVAIDEVRRIYEGELTRWSSLGGTNSPVEPVVQPLGSDIEAFFDHAVMGNEPVTAPSHRAESDSAVIRHVLGNPRAMGYVSLSADSSGVKVLRVAALTGLPYWKPDLEAIHRGDYPLTRFVNAYLRATGPKLSHGLITFLTSIEGQRIVYESGYVPTAVPVRFVRRSRMLGSHP